MATNIERTDETWNPVTGCTKVSQGCKNCYAERLAPKVFAGQTVPIVIHEPAHNEQRGTRQRIFTDVLTHPDRLDAPLHWKKPRRIFVNSMSDLFHEQVPDEFINFVFGVMAVAKQHTFQILTKRPERMLSYMSGFRSRGFGVDHDTYAYRLACMATNDSHGYCPALHKWSGPMEREWPLHNVWLGVSVEDQATADERIMLLQQTPAAIRFLSCEPLLGPIDLRPHFGHRHDEHCPVPCDQVAGDAFGKGIHWVIAGGESGPKARPSHPDWFRSLRDQCAAAGVPFFFKQWGEYLPVGQSLPGYGRVHGATAVSPGRMKLHCGDNLRHLQYAFSERGVDAISLNDGRLTFRVGKKAAGRLLDGREHMEYPA